MGELLTVAEVAYLLRVSESTVQGWCKDGMRDGCTPSPKQTYILPYQT